MALYKQIWTYFDSQGTWGETWYRNAATLNDAANVPAILIGKRSDLLNTFTELVKIRTSAMALPRASKVVTYGQFGAGLANKADTDAAFDFESVIYRIGAKNTAGTRAITLRGMPEQATYRDPLNGATVLLPEFRAKADSFIINLCDSLYALLAYKRIGQDGLTQTRVISVDSQAADGTSIITTAAASGLASGDYAFFTKFSQKTFPGLKGQFNVRVTSPTTFLINYSTPGHRLFLPNTGFVHQAIPIADAQLDKDNFYFSHTGQRQTKNARTGSRGARRAPRLRAQS